MKRDEQSPALGGLCSWVYNIVSQRNSEGESFRFCIPPFLRLKKWFFSRPQFSQREMGIQMPAE